MKAQIILLLFTFSINLRSFAQSHSVEIWIRAFIPDPQNAGGGTGYISATPNVGSSVALHDIDKRLPNIYFATDHRGFSDSATATSRLETKFTLTLNADGSGKVVSKQNKTTASITRRVDYDTGSTLEQKLGSVDRDNIGNPAVASGVLQVIGQVQGRNLLTILGGNGPSIDYSYDIQWNPSTSTLITALTIGSFPAFEMYAKQPNGKWTPIIKQLPVGRPWQLGGDSFGIVSSRIVETKIVRGLTGKWESPLPEKRFTLEFEGNKVKWTERNPSGASLTKEVRMTELSGGQFKIERPNSDEVLAFLGFQQSLRSEIIARHPQPSFIVFFGDGEKLTAEWNGLIVTKDANAHLREMIQPGVRPSKILELSEQGLQNPPQQPQGVRAKREH